MKKERKTKEELFKSLHEYKRNLTILKFDILDRLREITHIQRSDAKNIAIEDLMKKIQKEFKI